MRSNTENIENAFSAWSIFTSAASWTEARIFRLFSRSVSSTTYAGDGILFRLSVFILGLLYDCYLILTSMSTTCHGRPYLLRACMNGSGSSCSMLSTPACFQMPSSMSFAPIIAGTPVV